MSIQEISSNFKRFLQDGDTQVALILIAVGISSFMLGRASIGSVAIEQKSEIIQTASMNAVDLQIGEETLKKEETTASVSQGEGMYVASKSGTKYHLPWCSGAQRIKEENKIWFGSKEEAERAGYTPAANCKGI